MKWRLAILSLKKGTKYELLSAFWNEMEKWNFQKQTQNLLV